MTVLAGASLPDRAGRWDLTLAGGSIASVEPHGRGPVAPGAVVLDGRLVSRPFVDAHLHLDKAYQGDRAANRSGSLAEAIRLARELGAALSTEEQLVARILRGAMAALVGGTTVLRSHIDVDRIVGLRAVEAALAARALLPPQLRLELVAFPQQGIDDVVHDLLGRSLALGVDAVGGIPAQQHDPGRHLERVFDLAVEHDVGVDLHVDESDDPCDRTLELVADEALRRGWEGRVVAGHCCSLVAQPKEVRAGIIDKVRAAGIHVVTLPSTNLYLQGREDEVPRRGLAPVAELLRRGVNVAYASDNIRDAFNPFGNASMVESGLLLAHAAHLGGHDQLATVFEMATVRPAAALAGRVWSGAPDPQLAPGDPADLLVFPVGSAQDVIVDQAPPATVYVGGTPIVHRHHDVEVLVGPRVPPTREERDG